LTCPNLYATSNSNIQILPDDEQLNTNNNIIQAKMISLEDFQLDLKYISIECDVLKIFIEDLKVINENLSLDTVEILFTDYTERIFLMKFTILHTLKDYYFDLFLNSKILIQNPQILEIDTDHNIIIGTRNIITDFKLLYKIETKFQQSNNHSISVERYIALKNNQEYFFHPNFKSLQIGCKVHTIYYKNICEIFELICDDEKIDMLNSVGMDESFRNNLHIFILTMTESPQNKILILSSTRFDINRNITFSYTFKNNIYFYIGI
jgi:hypothetical protein